MRKIIILTLLLGSIGQTFAQSGGIKTFSLKQAVEYGIQNNVNAKNGKLSEDEAKARNKEIVSMGLPQISGNFDYNYYILRPESPAIAKIFNDPNSLTNQVYKSLALNGNNPGLLNIINNYAAAHKDDKIYFVLPHGISAGVQLNQLVFDGRYFVGLKATKELLKVARLSTQSSEIDIKYNITKSYYETQAAKEIRRYLDSNLVTIQKLLHDTKETYKEGLTEELDVNRLELAEATLQSQINNIGNLYELSLSSLKFNMGMSIGEQIALTDGIEKLRNSSGTDIPKGFDPSQRVEAQQLEAALLLNKYDMKQRQAGYYPAMYGFLSYGGGSQVSNFADFFRKSDNGYGDKVSNWFQQSVVGFTIKVPIYDGGQKAASVKQAKLEMQKTQNQLENFKNASALQVQAARTTFYSNMIEEDNAKRSMALNDKIFKTTKVKFSEGIGSSFELIQTQTDLSSNQIRYITAIKNVLTSRADLDKALGIK